MTTAFIAGLSTPAGAYLARLLRARHTRVTGTAADLPRAEALLTALGADEVRLRATALDAAAPEIAYLLDGSVDVAAAAATWPGARLCIAVAPDADTAAVTAVRDRGSFAVAARLYDHASRFDPADGVLGICTAMRDGTAVPAGDLDTPRDIGWTPEYVDALWRMAHAEQPADHDVATGLGMTLRQVAHHAAGYFKVAADGLLPPPGTPGPVRLGAPSGLASATGWRAYTHGRDLVVALCEGLPAR